MISNPHKINVVSQASQKTVAGRSWRNFNERNARLKNPLPQHPDVDLKCGEMSILKRLSTGEQVLNLIEQVISKPYYCGTR